MDEREDQATFFAVGALFILILFVHQVLLLAL